MRRLVLFISIICACAFSALAGEYLGPVPRPTDSYGAAGSYTVQRVSFANSLDKTSLVHVFSPVGLSGKRPTWFFAHGFGAGDPVYYGRFIEHLVSHGSVVVYADYPEAGGPSYLYSVLDTGFKDAAAKYPELIDTTRVVFSGHSYGGGATPYLALKAFRERSWGAQARGLWIMAPWYSHLLEDGDLAALPADLRVVMQVYQDDLTNDHRMAIDVFGKLPLAADHKIFLQLNSDYLEGYYFHSSHLAPNTDVTGVSGTVAAWDALDSWGVDRLARAFDQVVFAGDAVAETLLFNQGRDHEIAQGATSSGVAMRPVLALANPEALYPENRYDWRFHALINPRRDELAIDLGVDSAQLVNVAARALCGRDDGTLMVGATVSGNSPKTLLVRAIGESLRAYGVGNPLADPVLRVYKGTQLQFQLDNWGSQDLPTLREAMTEVGAFALSSSSTDAAASLVFPVGAVTAHVGLKDGASPGVGMVELYKEDQGRGSRLTNLSIRSQVGLGEDVLNAGWVINGTGTVKLLIRALGPKLKDFGVNGVLENPKLEVYAQGIPLKSNDDWSLDSSASADQVREASTQLGVFALPEGGSDAALVLTLPEGLYTAVVSGVGGGTGVVLFELYVVP